MAGADAEGRCGGRRAAVGLLALVLTAGCSAATHEDASVATSLEVPPPPVTTVASASRPPQTATRIDRVSIESAPPTTRVVLQLDGTVEPEVSLLENRRLVIDVPNTTCAALPRVVEATGDALVERVRTGQHGPPENKSRIVIDLRQRADFSVRVQGDRIVAWLSPSDTAAAPSADGSGSRILFGAESGVAMPSPPAAAPSPPPAPPEPAPLPVAAPEPTPQPAPPATPEPAIEATPAPTPLPTSEPTLAPSPEPTPSATPELLIEATPPPSVEPTPIATPERTLAATPESAVTTPAAAEPMSRPTAAPTSAPTAPARAAEAPPAGGSKRVSIDFTEADVRTVVELIASAGGYKVLFSPEVGGTVTISLVDRPWEDALATVLRAKRLREVRHEDVMLITPAGR